MKLISIKKQDDRLYLVKYKTGFPLFKIIERLAFKPDYSGHYSWLDSHNEPCEFGMQLNFCEENNMDEMTC